MTRSRDQWHLTSIGWSTYQPATAPLRALATIKVPFTTLVSIVRSGAVSFHGENGGYEYPYVPSVFRRTTKPYESQ